MQKLVRICGGDTAELNEYLKQDWVVKDFKPIATHVKNVKYYSTYVYVLLEKI